MENQILEAINEIYNENFKTFEEIFDIYSYDEAIDAYLQYEGIINYTGKIKRLYETFYNMIAKTDKELFQ